MNILHTYFNTQLVNAGLPDNLEIFWSLSYCQGDGMAFYGTIEHTQWLELFSHIYPNQKRQYRKFKRLIESIIEWDGWDVLIQIERNQFGHRYSHFNTMEIDAPCADDFRFFYDEQAKKTWYFPKNKVNEYQALWDNFINDLEEYIRDLSRQLASDGYRIIEATPSESEIAYQFETENYRIELIKDTSDLYACDVGDDNFEAICQDFIQGECGFADVCAKVIDKQTGVILGASDWCALTYDTKDNTFGGLRQELIREAISATRAQNSLIMRQARLMQKQFNYAIHTKLHS